MKSLQQTLQENQINENINSSYSLAVQKAMTKIVTKELEKIKNKALEILQKSSKAIRFHRIEDFNERPFIKCIMFEEPSSGPKMKITRLYINFTLEEIQYSDKNYSWDPKWRTINSDLSNLESLISTTN